ncbi:F0F1 ATP synthase subunit B [Mycobacterium sp. MYCO198283]|uniref:F0F1 ATP synthase subunit B n=1 Tax=Mycobacterium sp. MYCO198283 TaxID=2883505 RepID=UPI001E61C80E|nr:F0F1 ATP synthase subunit B [Mycobacterium sp. MYCO198283]MCG5430690.1 F0F1 ATP synthase subunit B [Mycobacterium sp. MYCO198283]
MGDVTAIVLAAEEGGQSNFLIPNGTFFFVLLIFLIVLGVIGKFVVPPISQVLRDREAMVTKTAEDNRKAAELSAAADADYRKELNAARSEAARIRDEARAEGRAIVEEHRGRASEEASAMLKQASEDLRRQGERATAELRSSIDTLSATLASRVLGVDVSSTAATGSGR